MRFMILSMFFAFIGSVIVFPGARLLAAERYFISGLIIKATASFFFTIAGALLVLALTAG